MSIKIRPYKRHGVVQPGRWEMYLVAKRPTGEIVKEKATVPDPIPGRPTSKTWASTWAQQRYAALMAQPVAPEQIELIPEAPRTQTLSEFAPRFIEWATTERHKPSEIASKQHIIKKHLAPVMGDKPLDQLTPLDLQALKARLKDHSPKTLNNVLAVLSKLLKVAVDLEVIATVPINARGKKAEAPEMSFYEFEDYAALTAAAEAISPMHLLLVLLGGDAGLRRGEMIALDWSDVDLKRAILTIRHSEWRENVTSPKGNRSRKVPMTKRLHAALEAVEGQAARVLSRSGGASMTAETCKWWIQQAQAMAKLEVNGKLHILRHTFCSHLAMKGANAITIKDLAGHRSLDTTNRYMHLSPNHRATAIGLLDQRTDAAIRQVTKEKGPVAADPLLGGGAVAATISELATC